MTHKLKDCLERPRKKGAKFTGKDIAPDEVLHDERAGLNGLEGMGDWDAKRDRWDGYDPAQHKAVVAEYEALEEARRKLREEAIDKGSVDADAKAVKKAAKAGKPSKKRKKDAEDDDDFGSSDESDVGDGAGDDEDKYAEGADVAGQRMDTKTRVTVRNLRIREDTAKYLRNLDPDSAYYDPKTRSMREAPVATARPEDVRLFPPLPPLSFLISPLFSNPPGHLRRRQLCPPLWRRGRSPTAPTLRLAIRAARERRPHQLEPDPVAPPPPRVPREEGGAQGDVLGVDPVQVRRGEVPPERPARAPWWADGGLRRVLEDGAGRQGSREGQGEEQVRGGWCVARSFPSFQFRVPER